MTSFDPKLILVPYDFSRGSEQALRYARLLAARLEARLAAVHVSPWPSARGAPVSPAARAEELQALERDLRRAVGEGVACRVIEGVVDRAILDEAQRLGAGLIVMGTRARTGAARFLLGSQTEAVVRRSRVPVLALRRAAAGPPRRILAPVKPADYSLRGFRLARDAAWRFGASVTLLHVKERGPLSAPELSRLEREAEPAHVELRVVDGEAVARIAAASRRHDLVVLAAHRRGGVREALLGTTAEQVLRRSWAPVLCVPAPAPQRPTRARSGAGRRARRFPARVRGRSEVPIKL